MSPSSIERSARLAMMATESAGLALGRHEIALVVAASESTTRYARTAPAPDRLFRGRPTGDQLQLLSRALIELLGDLRDRFLPLHVALPDPLGIVAALEFDSLPKSEAKRQQLVRWRIARELGLREAELEVVHQDLGTDNGKRLVWVQAVDVAWLEVAKGALQQAGIVCWSINQSICFRLNRYRQRIVRDRAPGALLAVDADAWTVVVWDSAARPRLVRSHWRLADMEHTDAEYDGIAGEFERAVLAYVHGEPHRSVENVYVSAGDESTLLAAAVDRRLYRPCVSFGPLDGGAGSGAAATLARIAATSA